MTVRKSFICVAIVLFAFSHQINAAAIFSYQDRAQPTVGRKGMVASQEAQATQAGLKVLKAGGNAFDAAVAVGFTLAVTLPRAGNLGGGGFMVAYVASENRVYTLDFREKAPIKASQKMFVTQNGDVDSEKSRFSLLATGVPGTVSGLCDLHEKLGSLRLKFLLKDAINIANRGIPMTEDLGQSLQWMRPYILKGAAKEVFFNEQGYLFELGHKIKQRDLANTLNSIARGGKTPFYEGRIAEKIASYMAQNGGLITLEDLKKYQPVWREPIYGTYKGLEVYTMPPPSSGGVHLVQLLNMLEGFDLADMGHNSAAYIHLFSEAAKRAYADRAHFLGDPDFTPIPIQHLVSKAYAKRRVQDFNLKTPSPSEKIYHGRPQDFESNDTTHFSVADQYGNAVAITYTLNFSYGNGLMVPGTGILLNNQMDDFSAKPGVPNAYGLIGGTANAIAPEKRMLSSMTPTIVLRDQTPFIITGSPGGSRIITTVLQQLINVTDFGMNIQEATNVPRVHHQLYPDEIRVERGLSPDTLSLLQKRGHKINIQNAMGSLQSIMIEDGIFYGASDPRKPGSLVKGY